MNKVIVRKMKLEDYSMDMLESDLNFISCKEVLIKFYNENQVENLFSSFEKIKETEMENDYFEMAYELNDTYLLNVNNQGHLYLYKKEKRNIRKKIQWIYIIGKLYIGDSWWFDDGEIIRDIQKYTFLEFLNKYKML